MWSSAVPQYLHVFGDDGSSRQSDLIDLDLSFRAAGAQCVLQIKMSSSRHHRDTLVLIGRSFSKVFFFFFLL